MTSFYELFNDLETVAQTAITIPPAKIQQAAELSSPILRPTKQWSTYLNGLALFGFEQWLAERDPTLTLNQEYFTLKQPQTANILDGVSRLTIGDYKICLLVMGCNENENITLPRPMLDLADYAAHFYILVIVREEIEQVYIKGLIRYEQLKAMLVSPQTDWTYQIPLNWFDQDPNHLLLYLRCLKSTPIDLSINSQIQLIPFSELKKTMSDSISELSLPDCQLWQILTWQQGASLLSYPELLDWLYRLQSTPPSPEKIPSFSAQLLEIRRNIAQSVINVRRWLQNELDEFSQSLSWVLVPSVAWQTDSIRSLSDPTTVILKKLQLERGFSIPSTVTLAYRDFTLVEYLLRLSTVIWQENHQEWRLLLILSTAGQNDFLPKGMTIMNETNVLVESQTNEHYLYSLLASAPNEPINLTLTLATGESLTLPPFILITE